jgi:hypothetical protein
MPIEVEINKEWKFWLYIFFQIVLTLGVLIVICIVGYFILFNENIAYKQLSNQCDKIFGVGNWTIQDTKVRTNWYSIGQEFTCVQNGTENYYNEVMNKT